MQSLLFWKSWPRQFRFILYVLAVIFIGSLLFMWYGYFAGVNGVIPWERLQEQKLLESIIHTFRTGPFTLSVPGENYVIFEYFQGGSLTPNATGSYIFLFILAVVTVSMITIISTLERFWYLAGMTLFIVFIISLRFEVLGLFGYYNYYGTAVILILLVGPSVYFNMVRKYTTFLTRLITFSVITLLVILLLTFFSTAEKPLLHISVTSYGAALILTVLFILVIAHEILASFIALMGHGNATSRNFNHFAIITGIYLLNVIITALHEMKVIEWNFVYINLYLLFTISGILAVWGFRIREPLYGNIFSFYPVGAFFIISLGALAFATTAHMLINANDAGLRVVRAIIIFSHAGYGILFFTYILSNFAAMMWRNLPVYKLLYKPNRMPYFTFQFAGLIATLAFVFYVGWRTVVYNGLAGFYNHLADLHMVLENEAFALAHYDKSQSFAFQNHHANYALGKLKTQRYALEEARRNYQLANGNPSEFSLINEGNLFLWENNIFEAISSFRKAIQQVPESGRLHNNLGFAFGKVHNIDSAIFYLNKALETSGSREPAETNFFAIAATEYIPLRADSVLKTFQTAYPATIANALALATLQQQPFSININPLENHHLNLYTATLLNNFILQNIKTIDSTFIERAYEIASDSINEDYSEALKLGLASAYYHQENISRALSIMGELAYLSQAYQGKYNYLMGLWSLEQNSPLLASTYFDYAVLFDYKDATLYNAIALTEANLVNDALTAWDSVAKSTDTNEQEMAARIKRILSTDLQEADELADPEKYQFCRYVLNVFDTLEFNQLIQTFQNNNYKATALLDMAKRQYDWSQTRKAVQYLSMIDGTELTDETLYRSIHDFQLLMLAAQKKISQLEEELQAERSSGKDQKLTTMLYDALIAEAHGDTLQAEKKYHILARYNPYFEDGIIAAANFYRSYAEDPLRPYNILAEAIHINNSSVKLLQAYAAEAMRQGFEEYANNARQRIEELYLLYR